MALFGTRRMPAHLADDFARFCAQAERVEAARSALLSCLPVGRVDPVPVPVGLDLVDEELAAVAADLASWRREEVAAAWAACRSALSSARAAVPHARDVAATTVELEELLEAVGRVVEPLDAWGDAERRWRSLRARR